MLRLTYWPEDEWHGELIVEARHAGFSGKASAWFDSAALRRFAEPLRCWPPVADGSAALRGGYFSDSTTGSQPVETHVGITITQRGSRGRYWLEARLSEPDEEIQPQAATLCFPVEPAALLRFAGAIEALAAAGGEACLPASGGSDPDPDLFHAPVPVERPHSPLFMALLDGCHALIGRIEAAGCETILAGLDWDAAKLCLAAPGGAAEVLDLAALRDAAQQAARPRAWFESHALYLLLQAQHRLTAFFRDGPTDDIPYYTATLMVSGAARMQGVVAVSNVVFRFRERQA